MQTHPHILRLVVLTTRRHSPALNRLLQALESAPVQLAGIVCARNPRESFLRHRAANSRLIRATRQRHSADGSTTNPSIKRDIVVRPFGASFDSPRVAEAIGQFSPDLVLHVYGPIFRPLTLEVAGLGLLNCHMGWLPLFRGMNALEWSVIHGYPTGNTVHFVDSGIDTGDIVGFYPVPISACRSLGEARRKLAGASANHLVHAVTMIARGDVSRHPQPFDAGRQYFRMHGLLRSRADAAISSGYRPRVSIDELSYVMDV